MALASDVPIAHQSEFELLDARWDLKSGRTVDLRVVEKPGEDAPHPFKRFQKKRGSVGTRFHAVFSFGGPIIYEGDAMLAGWGDGSDKGQWVRFWLDEDSTLHPFAGFKHRKGKEVGDIFAGVFVELADDEQPAEDTGPNIRMTLSQRVWLLCHKDELFIRFFDEKIPKPGSADYAWTPTIVHRYIRWLCGIESLSELDRDERAAAIYREQIGQPFMRWSSSE